MGNEIDPVELGHRFMQAAGDGDAEAARECMHPDAQIWHNYDGVTQTVEENMQLMLRMKALSSKRVYQIHLMEAVAGGYVQRHTLHITSLDGERTYSAEALALIEVRDGKISRIEEFINPAPILEMFASQASE